MLYIDITVIQYDNNQLNAQLKLSSLSIMYDNDHLFHDKIKNIRQKLEVRLLDK